VVTEEQNKKKNQMSDKAIGRSTCRLNMEGQDLSGGTNHTQNTLAKGESITLSYDQRGKTLQQIAEAGDAPQRGIQRATLGLKKARRGGVRWLKGEKQGTSKDLLSWGNGIRERVAKGEEQDVT